MTPIPSRSSWPSIAGARCFVGVVVLDKHDDDDVGLTDRCRGVLPERVGSGGDAWLQKVYKGGSTIEMLFLPA
jgi:hypothetical protein